MRAGRPGQPASTTSNRSERPTEARVGYGDRYSGRLDEPDDEPTPDWTGNVLKVALTGNIASGKSEVADVWRAEGVPIIDADELARRAVRPGSLALERIAEAWGPGILLASGELDRAALRDVVFRDPKERERLESIVHPEVQRLREQAVEQARADGVPIVVSDIPLLFEVGLENEFDLVVLVDSPEEVRLERLVRLRGLPVDDARRMISAQWLSDRKRPNADFVIENDGSIEELRQQARRVWREIAAVGNRGVHRR